MDQQQCKRVQCVGVSGENGRAEDSELVVLRAMWARSSVLTAATGSSLRALALLYRQQRAAKRSVASGSFYTCSHYTTLYHLSHDTNLLDCYT